MIRLVRAELTKLATTRLISGMAAAMAAFAVLTVAGNILGVEGAPPLSADSLPVLVSSHVLAEVAQTVDQVVIIAAGRLVTQSTLAALTARTDQLVRVRTPAAETLQALLAAQGIQVELDGADQLLAVGTTPETVGKAAAAAGIVIYEMTAERSNLEDVFLQLTSFQGA